LQKLDSQWIASKRGNEMKKFNTVTTTCGDVHIETLADNGIFTTVTVDGMVVENEKSNSVKVAMARHTKAVIEYIK